MRYYAFMHSVESPGLGVHVLAFRKGHKMSDTTYLELSAELLDFDGQINFCDLVGSLSIDVGDWITYESDLEYDACVENSGYTLVAEEWPQNGEHFHFEEVGLEYARDMRDILLGNYEDLFAGVELGEVTTFKPSRDLLSANDYAPVSLKVDGDWLFAKAREYGITRVDDGRNISGFIRTCSDSHWAVIKTLEALLELEAKDWLEVLHDDVRCGLENNMLSFPESWYAHESAGV